MNVAIAVERAATASERVSVPGERRRSCALPRPKFHLRLLARSVSIGVHRSHPILARRQRPRIICQPRHVQKTREIRHTLRQHQPVVLPGTVFERQSVGGAQGRHTSLG